MTLPQLRVALRDAGLQPGGGLEALRTRLLEHAHGAAPAPTADAVSAGASAVTRPGDVSDPSALRGNNYSRPDGQNVGNFISDRPSSRVIAPPGGGSQITLG